MRKLVILFLSVFFWCCNQPETVPVMLQAEELEVIKQTFPDDYCCNLNNFEVPKFLPKKWKFKKRQLDQLKKLRDSLRITKPVSQIWFVKDTLFNPKQFVLNHQYYNDARIKIDTVFFKLEKDLFTNLYPKQPAKLTGLIIRKQIFKSIDSAKTSTQTQKHYVLLSRVVFNAEHNKACYYFSQGFTALGYNNWLEEEMMFAEKRQEKWHLIYRKLYSIT